MDRWLVDLEAGRRHETAWDAFLGRYRALVFATIRHYVRDADDVMDVFTWVCERLRQDDFRRLKGYASAWEHKARFTTWLVVVIRHLCIDWLRQRNGRLRPRALTAAMPELQARICEEVFHHRRSHAETFELIRSRDDPALTFGRFLKELAAVYRVVMPGSGRLPRALAAPFLANSAEGDDGLARQTRRALDTAMSALPDADRVAVEMYVVDGVPAAEVARVLGLSNAKAVYNRVYRALAAVRERLEAAGLGRDDL
jgi:RNA polymerase sigma factor (sigma-70 family)